MEETYGVAEYADKALMTPENLILPVDYHSLLMSSAAARIPLLGSEEFLSGAEPEDEAVASAVTKAKIASHPQYPRLLQAYIDCQKVGAPPEIACWLDEIRREKDVCKSDVVSSTCFGDDPELDEFMERYCELLVKYKSELAGPLDEATRFLNKIEMQLSHLCCSPSDGSVPTLSEEGGVSSSEEITSGGEDRELKDRLLRKFGSHIGTLKLEFSKKKKKGKLPKEARLTLLQWWNLHYKWPYPTEADKIELAKSTGLDQKQINNWFINQRKRHWKPSENMHFSMMENLTGRFLASSSDE